MHARLVIRRSRIRSSGLAPFFRWGWSWNLFYGHSLPSADSRREVVSYVRKNMRWVLVNCLGLTAAQEKCGKVNWLSRHDHSCWPRMLSNNTTTVVFCYVCHGFVYCVNMNDLFFVWVFWNDQYVYLALPVITLFVIRPPCLVSLDWPCYWCLYTPGCFSWSWFSITRSPKFQSSENIILICEASFHKPAALLQMHEAPHLFVMAQMALTPPYTHTHTHTHTDCFEKGSVCFFMILQQ